MLGYSFLFAGALVLYGVIRGHGPVMWLALGLPLPKVTTTVGQQGEQGTQAGTQGSGATGDSGAVQS